MTDPRPGQIYLIPTVVAPGTQHLVLPEQIRLTIKELDYFLVENLRTARRFISSLQLGKNIGDLKLELLDKETHHKDLRAYFNPILEGKSAGVLSESGCPGVADPGSAAVALAHQLGIAVIPLVGPSALLLSLMASGFNGQSFVFHGYLPIDKQDRSKQIKALEKDAYAKDQTQLFIETPYRNEQLFEALLTNCQGQTLLCVAQNLTAPEAMIKTMPVDQWKKEAPPVNKQPAVFLLYHP